MKQLTFILTKLVFFGALASVRTPTIALHVKHRLRSWPDMRTRSSADPLYLNVTEVYWTDAVGRHAD